MQEQPFLQFFAELMETNKMKKPILSFILFFSLLTAVHSKTVKVGYYTDSGNFMSGFSKSDPRYGYAYEYLQTIAVYTGWSYEYVYGDWDHLYNALIEGKIDILPDVSKTPTRERFLLFPDYPMGKETYYLYSRNKDEVLSLSNFSSWEGKRIGLRKDCNHYDLFMDWQKDKNLKCEYFEFLSSDPYTEHFNEGRLDLLLEIDMVADKKWNPIVKIGSSDFYLAVTKKKTQLLKELNTALAEIFSMNPYYNDMLWLEYFSDTNITKGLSERERKFLKSRDKIKVGCLNDNLPFSAQNVETTEMEGLVVEVFNTIRAQHDSLVPPVEYVVYSDYNLMVKDLIVGKIDIAAPVIRLLETYEDMGLVLTQSITSLMMGFVYNTRTFDGNIRTIAVPENEDVQELIKSNYAGARTLVCKNYTQCLDAVLSGKADGAVFNTYKIRSLLNRNQVYQELDMAELSSHCGVSFASSLENSPLASIINKALMIMPAENISASTEFYALKSQNYTKHDFVKSYLLYIIGILVLIAILSSALILAFKRIQDAIDHDTLTHLLNRHRLNYFTGRFIRRYNNRKEDFSLLLFDIDDFKQLNDRYGHSFGDVVLKKVAALIDRNSRSCDKVFRWGGEEFLIIRKGNIQEAFEAAQNIIQELNDSPIDIEGNPLKVTVSVGVTTYENGITYDELFKQADNNLYKAKASGKNKAIMQ